MQLGKVLFVGGDPSHFPSVQIRCKDIASRLGIDCAFLLNKAEEVPAGYSVFICVKASLNQDELLKLSKRGPVIWDVIDNFPPKLGVSIYLASTKKIKLLLGSLKHVEIIPHHHCNFDSIPNPNENRRPGWIGTLHWLPKIKSFDHDVYSVNRMTSQDTSNVYRQIGIGLNLRTKNNISANHAKFNTGIKLINCIGFGIPSVSSDEPAYREIGEDCTIFTDLQGSAHWVQELQINDQLYLKIRNNCLLKASKYHVSSILKMYEEMIKSL